jgi:type II secretory pathway component PulM
VAEGTGSELLKKFALGGGVSAGGATVLVLYELAKKDPTLLQQVVGWGPMFVALVIVILVIVNPMIQNQRDGTKAMQEMADAVRAIATKDDRQAEQLQTLAAYNATQSERMLRHLEDARESLTKISTQQERTGVQLQSHHLWLAQIGEALRRRGVDVESPKLATIDVDGQQAKGASA